MAKLRQRECEVLSQTLVEGDPLLDKAARKWDELADGWQETGPPSSPSRQDIASYRRFLLLAIKNVKNPKVMVLGCTPKLRSMIRKLGVALTCVDVSRRMLAVTSRNAPVSGMDEELVQQNWLTMNLGQSQFAAILGDKILDNVPYREWPRLNKRIVWHLRPAGSFITRVAPCDRSLISRSFEELFREWALRYGTGGVSCTDAASGLWEQALGASTRAVPGPQSISVFAEEIAALERNPRNRSAEHGRLLVEFRRLFGRGLDFEWTAYTLGNVIDALDGDMALVRIARSEDYLVGPRQPVLQFQTAC